MSKEDLAKVIQGELNKQFKHQKVAEQTATKSTSDVADAFDNLFNT